MYLSQFVILTSLLLVITTQLIQTYTRLQCRDFQLSKQIHQTYRRTLDKQKSFPSLSLTCQAKGRYRFKLKGKVSNGY